MSLFATGDFVLHSGARSSFKTDCDYLSDASIAAVAASVGPKLLFSSVVGVETGGARFAAAMRPYAIEGSTFPRLLVDDVLTTGASMLELYKPGDIGLVLFARNPCPPWVRSIWQLNVAL